MDDITTCSLTLQSERPPGGLPELTGELCSQVAASLWSFHCPLGHCALRTVCAGHNPVWHVQGCARCLREHGAVTALCAVLVTTFS